MAENERPNDEGFPAVELGDIVRLKAPYKTRVGGKEQLYRYGIVVEILQVTPRGKVRNVSLHLYTGDGRLYLGPNRIPEFVDHHAAEYELYHRAKDMGYVPLLPVLEEDRQPADDEEE
jgi:hypothetical protein